MGIFTNAVWFLHSWWHYTRQAFEKTSQGFDPRALDVDLTGKHFIVTGIFTNHLRDGFTVLGIGANSGLGFEVTKELAKRGAFVHMLCRSRERGLKAIDELVAATQEAGIAGEHLILHECDVSKPQSIAAFCEDYARQWQRVDVVVNNAGVLVDRLHRDATTDLEQTLATNVLGPYVLTETLFPLMAPNARVVNVTSGGMLTQRLDVQFFDDTAQESTFDGAVAYAQTKRQLMELTHYWAEEHPTVFFAAPHPGWADTPGVQSSLPGFHQRLRNSLRTAGQGADSVVWCAISPQALHLPSGSFVCDRAVESEHLFGAGTQNSPEERLQFVQWLAGLC
jgi:dehydrogenase/reductase SDR family protein 12